MESCPKIGNVHIPVFYDMRILGGGSHSTARNCGNCSLKDLDFSESAKFLGRCCSGPVIMYSFSSRPLRALSLSRIDGRGYASKAMSIRFCDRAGANPL